MEFKNYLTSSNIVACRYRKDNAFVHLKQKSVLFILFCTKCLVTYWLYFQNTSNPCQKTGRTKTLRFKLHPCQGRRNRSPSSKGRRRFEGTWNLSEASPDLSRVPTRCGWSRKLVIFWCQFWQYLCNRWQSNCFSNPIYRQVISSHWIKRKIIKKTPRVKN